MFRGGPCPPLYIQGDRVTWKVLAEYSWSPTTIQSGSFLCTAASSTPIRVVTREVRYIHELSLTLEQSMPISSLATPGLTRVLRARGGRGLIWKLGGQSPWIPRRSGGRASQKCLPPRRSEDPWCGVDALRHCNTQFIKEHKPSNHIRARIKSHVYTIE